MENVMQDVNFIKNIDNLGRIVIPMDVRRKLNINTGDVLSITCNDKKIELMKYSSLEKNSKVIDILNLFVEHLQLRIILLSKEEVIYSNIVPAGVKLDNQVRLLIKNASVFNNSLNEFIFGEHKVKGIYNMLPIIDREGIQGSLIIFSEENTNYYTYCELLSKLVMLELNIT